MEHSEKIQDDNLNPVEPEKIPEEDQVVCIGEMENQYDEILQKAKSLLEIHDKKDADIQIRQWNQEQKIKIPDTKLKTILKQAEKQVQDEIKKSFQSDDVDEEEKESRTRKIYNFAKSKIIKTVVSVDDSSLIYGIIQLNNHKEAIDLSSHKAVQWIKSEFFKNDEGGISSEEQYKAALAMIVAHAVIDETPREQLYNRIAQTDDEIYYDLCNDKWEAVKINKIGYEIISLDENTPIFIRKSHQQSQVYPKNEIPDALNKFVDLIRIPYNDRIVFNSHFVSFYLESQPMPIMVIFGEHGSIKSSTTEALKMCVDPATDNKTTIPFSQADITLCLYNRYLINFDNITGFKSNISDLFCKAITGDGIPKRKHYENSEEVLFKYKRKIIMNGIAPSIEKPDFKDRSIFYQMPTVKEEDRITMKEFIKKRDRLIPSILHEVFTALSKSFDMYDRVDRDTFSKLRMADFTIWGECISKSLGHQPLEFVNTFNDKHDSNMLNSVNTYPIITLIDEQIGNENYLEMKTFELYQKIKYKADLNNINTRKWPFPDNTAQFSRQINNLLGTFRKLGMEIQIENYNKRDEKYPRGISIIKIWRINKKDNDQVIQTQLTTVSPVIPVNGNSCMVSVEIDRNRIIDSEIFTTKNKESELESSSDSDDRDTLGITEITKKYKCQNCQTTYTTTKTLDEVQFSHRIRNPDHTLVEVDPE